ncbi:MAG: DNA-binding protein [Streptococcus parauberis]
MKKSIPKTHQRILALIPVGKDRTITGQELATITKMNLRTVQTIISRLIIDYGCCICGSRDYQRGYYIPQNDSERLEGIRALTNQQASEERRIDALLNADLNSYKEYLKEGE